MGKPKTTKPAEPSAPAKPDETLAAADEVTPTTLTSDDWVFLDKVSTFLFHIQAYAARARLHGYDDEDHELLKSLWAKASGRDRPLSHWIGEGVLTDISTQFNAEQTRLLQEVDAFENRWFPRIRSMLQRSIPEDRHEAFAAAFFKDLSQQPLGPGVLDSVPTLLVRFEALEHSKEPGAKDAHALGVKRGLTKARIAQVRALVDAANDAMPKKAPTPQSLEQLAKAKAEQLAALKKLRRVFNEVSTALRDVFGPRVLIRLGLAQMKRSAKNDAEPADEGEAGDDVDAGEAAKAPAGAGKGGK